MNQHPFEEISKPSDLTSKPSHPSSAESLSADNKEADEKTSAEDAWQCFWNETEEDQDKALAHYCRLAESGDMRALNNASVCRFIRGKGTDWQEAAQGFRKAAVAGIVCAWNNLGMATFTGKGVKRSEIAAAGHFQVGHALGSLAASYNYARCSELGLGRQKDFQAALTIYRDLAQRGFQPAAFYLDALKASDMLAKDLKDNKPKSTESVVVTPTKPSGNRFKYKNYNVEDASALVKVPLISGNDQHQSIQLLMTHAPLLYYPLQIPTELTPIFFAAYTNDVEALEVALSSNPSLAIAATSNHFSLLAVATLGNSLETVEKLLSFKGTHVNCHAALSFAAFFGYIPIMQKLLALGISANRLIETHAPPLIFATLGGSLEAVILLLENGATIDQPDKGNRTALWHATSEQHYPLMQYLYSHQASPVVKDSDGVSPFLCVIIRNNYEGFRLFYDFKLSKADKQQTLNELTGQSIVSGRCDMLRRLLFRNDVTQFSGYLMDSLFVIDHRARIEIVEFLVESGADFDEMITTPNTAVPSTVLHAYQGRRDALLNMTTPLSPVQAADLSAHKQVLGIFLETILKKMVGHTDPFIRLLAQSLNNLNPSFSSKTIMLYITENNEKRIVLMDAACIYNFASHPWPLDEHFGEVFREKIIALTQSKPDEKTRKKTEGQTEGLEQRQGQAQEQKRGKKHRKKQGQQVQAQGQLHSQSVANLGRLAQIESQFKDYHQKLNLKDHQTQVNSQLTSVSTKLSTIKSVLTTMVVGTQQEQKVRNEYLVQTEKLAEEFEKIKNDLRASLERAAADFMLFYAGFALAGALPEGALKEEQYKELTNIETSFRTQGQSLNANALALEELHQQLPQLQTKVKKLGHSGALHGKFNTLLESIEDCYQTLDPDNKLEAAKTLHDDIFARISATTTILSEIQAMQDPLKDKRAAALTHNQQLSNDLARCFLEIKHTIDIINKTYAEFLKLKDPGPKEKSKKQKDFTDTQKQAMTPRLMGFSSSISSHHATLAASLARLDALQIEAMQQEQQAMSLKTTADLHKQVENLAQAQALYLQNLGPLVTLGSQTTLAAENARKLIAQIESALSKIHYPTAAEMKIKREIQASILQAKDRISPSKTQAFVRHCHQIKVQKERFCSRQLEFGKNQDAPLARLQTLFNALKNFDGQLRSFGAQLTKFATDIQGLDLQLSSTLAQVQNMQNVNDLRLKINTVKEAFAKQEADFNIDSMRETVQKRYTDLYYFVGGAKENLDLVAPHLDTLKPQDQSQYQTLYGAHQAQSKNLEEWMDSIDAHFEEIVSLKAKFMTHYNRITAEISLADLQAIHSELQQVYLKFKTEIDAIHHQLSVAADWDKPFQENEAQTKNLVDNCNVDDIEPQDNQENEEEDNQVPVSDRSSGMSPASSEISPGLSSEQSADSQFVSESPLDSTMPSPTLSPAADLMSELISRLGSTLGACFQESVSRAASALPESGPPVSASPQNIPSEHAPRQNVPRELTFSQNSASPSSAAPAVQNPHKPRLVWRAKAK